MGKHSSSFTPRLLAAPSAAHYLGVSETTLRTLGLPRRVLGGKRLYDVIDLDQYASNLPIEGNEDETEENTCEGKFGRTA